VVSTPQKDEIKRRAGRATRAFLQLHARRHKPTQNA
jgi:hypothetical protein